MSDLTFQVLLHCQYSGNDNSVDLLQVEHLVDDEWQKLDLDIYSPGFDIFMYSILACQHMYFRNNASEYGLLLQSSQGLITVIADKHRSIDTLNVEFTGKLKSGKPNKETINTIAARMKLCPVSINLKDIPNNNVMVSFETI